MAQSIFTDGFKPRFVGIFTTYAIGSELNIYGTNAPKKELEKLINICSKKKSKGNELPNIEEWLQNKGYITMHFDVYQKLTPSVILVNKWLEENYPELDEFYYID